MESWYFNAGDGAYKVSEYDVGEVADFTFGMGGRTITKPSNWESKDMWANNWGPND